MLDNRIIGQVEQTSSEEGGITIAESKRRSPHRSPKPHRTRGSPRSVSMAVHTDLHILYMFMPWKAAVTVYIHSRAQGIQCTCTCTHVCVGFAFLIMYVYIHVLVIKVHSNVCTCTCTINELEIVVFIAAFSLKVAYCFECVIFSSFFHVHMHAFSVQYCTCVLLM